MEHNAQQIEVLEKKVLGSRSPLFAQLAALYLESGRPQEALRVCEEGLANYPFYATGHLIRGRTLNALKMNAEARREFTWVLNYLPGATAVKKLLDEVPQGEEEILTSPAPPGAFKAKQEITFTPKKASAPAPIPEPPIQPPSIETPPSVIASEPPANDFGISSEPSATEDFSFQGGEGAVETPPVPDFGGFGGISETPPSVEAPPFETAATPTDDPFGFGGLSPAATEVSADQFGAPTAEPSAFGSFDEPGVEPAFVPPAQLEESTTDSGFSFGAPPSEEESFEVYAARMRGELTGENSISLDEFLNSKPAPIPEVPEPASPTIEELADKLQTAKKITPVINFASKNTTTASETDTPASTGFVTPTLAEIYAKQGWFDDAIKAYKTLANNKPADREKFLARVAELEEQKKNAEA